MNGFRIIQPVHLHGWRPVPIPRQLEFVGTCPACTDFGTVLIAKACGLRVGECPGCGWLGYMDRPPEGWLDELYCDWDLAGRAADIEGCLKINAGASPNAAFLGLTQSFLPPPKSLLEIGAGDGVGVISFRRMGYDAHGFEPSDHRREVASACLGVELHGSMQQVDGKFDVVLSHHVLEHVADLDTFMAECRRVQKPDGMLYIQVPNADKEPTMGQLLFLPHLHSFTLEALQALIQRNGYEVQKALKIGGDIVVIAMRNVVAPLRYQKRTSHRAKFQRAFSGKPDRYFHWHMKHEATAWKGFAAPAEIEGEKFRCLEVEPLECDIATVESEWGFVK